MLILGMDTATRTASIGLTEKQKLIGEFSLHVDKVHSKKLMPMLDQLLFAAGLDASDIDAIAVSAGPGSFTGLRIGMATAKGLAYALGVPLIGISTLAGLSYNCAGTDGLLCPILDARMSEFYTALYQWHHGALIPVREDAVMDRNELVHMLSQEGEKKLIIADPTLVEKLNLDGIPSASSIEYAPAHQVNPRGAAIALLGEEKLSRGADDSILTLQPSYLRRSQAEILYGQKVKE